VSVAKVSASAWASLIGFAEALQSAQANGVLRMVCQHRADERGGVQKGHRS
jgi:hypothetical protein